jgi:hypothetical protein
MNINFCPAFPLPLNHNATTPPVTYGHVELLQDMIFTIVTRKMAKMAGVSHLAFLY